MSQQMDSSQLLDFKTKVDVVVKLFPNDAHACVDKVFSTPFEAEKYVAKKEKQGSNYKYEIESKEIE